MTPNPSLLKSIEQLGYRVTVGDVAAQAGLEVNFAQQGLLALAADAGGHLQVAESGDIAYLFPKNFRSILRNKYWRLRWQEQWRKIWGVLFYLIRISFGIVLIVSIALMAIAIAAIYLYSQSNSDNEGSGNPQAQGHSSRGGNIVFFPRFWLSDLWWWFHPGYGSSRRSRRRKTAKDSPNAMGFLEAVFSFLFGDGDPNANLEERRWQEIGATIHNNNGAVAAEQLAPYFDKIEQNSWDEEDYLLPALVRFNGYPNVSDEGAIVYCFPELQVRATEKRDRAVPAYLEEKRWRFSAASSGQILLAVGLGALNIILALVLYSLLQDPQTAQLGGIVSFVSSIYWFLAGYGVAFLSIPGVRYFWIQRKNTKIEARNQERQERVQVLKQASESLRKKIAYARQFARANILKESDLAYSTETNLLEQNLKNADKIDREWQQRLESDS
ncbi:hypothetical protein [Lusitaniella coriacea]|uniref:hypothetical protein n=1 Tax=Lusitaniella coriacea TaxID=1983105 RepID=UPI003CEAC72E